MTLLVLAILGVPFLGAAALPALRRRADLQAGVALAAMAAIGVLGVLLWQGVSGGDFAASAAWIARPRIDAAVGATRLSAFFVVLVGGVGAAVVLYARAYLGHEATTGFWALLLAFAGGMVGIVLSDSLPLLFVFWEVTTVTSALLIGWHAEEAEARRGAVQAFLVTGAGSLALLAGILLLGLRTGYWRLSELAAHRAELVADPAHVLPLVLLLAGAFAKSAQVPFHFWLPGAMAAPAPVTAYLHSATMVNAGVYLVGRLFVPFSASPLWEPLLAATGLTTFLLCAWAALRSHDVKRVLAYATCSFLGMLVAQYGFAARTGFHHEMLSLLNHATYKSALFLLAGWVEKATGTRDLRVLAPHRWGLHSPTAAVLAATGVLAMSGVPLLAGFLGKEQFLQSLPAGGGVVALATAAGVLGSALTFAFSLRILLEIFGGAERPPERGAPGGPRPVSRWLLAVPLLLLVPQVAGGLAPHLVFAPLLDPQGGLPAGPAFWHHADRLLWLGLAAFAAGFVAYRGRRGIDRLPRGPAADPLVERLRSGTLRAAHAFSDGVQAGGHPRHVALVLLFAVLAVAAALASGEAGPRAPSPGEAGRAALPGALVAATAAATVLARERFSKALAAAAAGYGVALFYVLFRAPDLALTQLLVETLTLVLLLLAFRALPALAPEARPARKRLAHAFVAIGAGLAVAAVAFAAGTHAAPDPAGARQLALAEPEGHGRNAVNVILVDIRAGDTLGEIAVLGIAALGALALLQARRAQARP